ncbi:hypothetical protein LUZ60_014983 [Juncus effusus]|nr:hypothetical protein LUZ60_014983 [Juncus effusus]
MGSYSEIVDISSGEEDNMNKSSDGSNGSLGWISGILDEGFDDLIVMDELSTPPKKKGLDGKDDRGDEEDDGDDDDCLVLDSDPDKPASAVDGGGKEASDGSDELEIVGEKGQVACRDFPHPRHLCANFPFSTTPHDQHCKMCHCYVCESPAPCEFWNNSASTNLATISHCNATDKDPFFKKLRDVKKNSSKVPSLTSNPNFPTNPFSRVTPPWQPIAHSTSNMPHLNPNPNSHLNPIPNPNPNPRVITQPVPIQTQPSRTNVMRPCQTIQSHRAAPYHHPIRSRHISRSSSMQTYSTNRGPPGHPVLSANPNSNPTHSSAILNRPHSTSESLIRMRQIQLQTCALRRTVSSQSGGSTQAPAHQIHNNNMQNNLADVDSKSWQDILASVATELGVPDCLSNNATLVQQQVGLTFQQPGASLNNQGVNNGFGNNVSGMNGDLSLGEMNVNVSSQPASVSASSPLYEFQGNWGGSAPI